MWLSPSLDKRVLCLLHVALSLVVSCPVWFCFRPRISSNSFGAVDPDMNNDTVSSKNAPSCDARSP